MNVSVLRRGTGRDLVFLHGYLATKESFYPQIEYFSRFYRVTAFDFPGFGGSDPIPDAWSVGDYADWTENFLLEEGIAFPLVIAHSFGGRVAVKCLSRGDLFDRAVLCGCAGIRPRRNMRYYAQVYTYKFVRKIAPMYAKTHFGSAEYRTLSPLMRESYKKIVNEDLREDAEKISRPVLFINGEKDTATPPSSAKIYEARVAGSKRITMRGCGHFCHLDDPLAFNLAAEEFFNE